MLSKMTQEERERLRAEFLRRASEGFDRMFDPDRQEDMRAFTQREDRAMDIGTGLVRWALEQHTGADERATPAAGATPCPRCGGPAQEPPAAGGEAATREVESKAGKVPVRRAGVLRGRARRRRRDGGHWIEPLGAKHFPSFTQVLEFLHLLVPLYAAA